MGPLLPIIDLSNLQMYLDNCLMHLPTLEQHLLDFAKVLES